MGNSRRAATRHLPSAGDAPAPASAQANGILSRLRGDQIANALALLPPASAAEPSHRDLEVRFEGWGLVRLLVEKRRARHRRHSHYFWAAYRAEPVKSDDPGEASIQCDL